jgi:biotin transport system permease protein
MSMIGDYRPGTTALHRLPAGVKLLAMLVAAVATVVVRGWAASLVALAIAAALLAWSGAGLWLTLKTLRGIAVVVVLLFAWQAWQHGWPRAVETVGDIVALVLLATVLTATTRVQDILDAITAGLRPLRRVGVDADRVASPSRSPSGRSRPRWSSPPRPGRPRRPAGWSAPCALGWCRS